MTDLLTLSQTRINAFLECRLTQLRLTNPTLLEAMRYALLLGGKRMRPLLVYATGELFDADHNDLDVVAAAVECIHAFSLIHDDLPAMDDDDLRRGQPTCHIAFNEATAILAGDSLNSLAFELLSADPMTEVANRNRIDMIKLLAQSTGYSGMCGGQAMDVEATNKVISLAQLETLHRHKTGALIEASVTLGALCGENASAEDIRNLQTYARCVGLAFQVQDDILDVVGDTNTLGKPAGSDVELNKSTYPALLGLEGAQQKAQQLIEEALQALHAMPYNSASLEKLAFYIINRKY